MSGASPASDEAVAKAAEHLDTVMNQAYEEGQGSLLDLLHMAHPDTSSPEEINLKARLNDLFDEMGLRPLQVELGDDEQSVWMCFSINDLHYILPKWHYGVAMGEALRIRRSLPPKLLS